MKICFTILLLCIQVSVFAQVDTSGPVNKRVINAVVEIKNGQGTGSGFLVQLGQKRLLVTNKHMIGAWSPVDPLIFSDSIYINLYSTSGRLGPNFIKVGVKINTTGRPNIRIHPNPKIDIAAIDISDNIGNLTIPNTHFVDTTLFLKLDQAKNILSYGSQVFTIGYPAGIKAFKTNEPLVKVGYLSSSLDGSLIMEQTWPNRQGQYVKTLTEGKIFIVDGLIIPGNSGGPVMLSQQVVWIIKNGSLQYLHDPKNYFIGIVSDGYSNTGLTTVFSSDNILEVIRQF